MAYETNPLLAWYALPPNVRQQYTSGLKAAGELSPGAAVRDVVDESGNMVKPLAAAITSPLRQDRRR